MPEAPEHKEYAEGTVELNDVECCSLFEGFKQNLESVAALDKAFGKDAVQNCKSQTYKSNQLALQPHAYEQAVYHAIASVEYVRLKNLEPAEKLDCDMQHNATEHRTALEQVLKKIKPVVQ